MEDERRKRLSRKDARHRREGRRKLGVVGGEPRLNGHGLRIVQQHPRDGVDALDELLCTVLHKIVQHLLSDLADLSRVARADTVGDRQAVFFVLHKAVTETLCEVWDVPCR